jgi:hypothetical protein
VTRRATLLLGGAVLVAAASGVSGRVERKHWIETQNDGIAHVRAEVAARFTRPFVYRLAPDFACLVWKTSDHPFGHELCYRPSGAIVEAIDRRPGHDPTIWTVRPEPSTARIHDDPRVVARLLARLGANTGSTIPLGTPDLGPH